MSKETTKKPPYKCPKVIYGDNCTYPKCSCRWQLSSETDVEKLAEEKSLIHHPIIGKYDLNEKYRFGYKYGFIHGHVQSTNAFIALIGERIERCNKELSESRRRLNRAKDEYKPPFIRQVAENEAAISELSSLFNTIKPKE